MSNSNFHEDIDDDSGEIKEINLRMKDQHNFKKEIDNKNIDIQDDNSKNTNEEKNNFKETQSHEKLFKFHQPHHKKSKLIF